MPRSRYAQLKSKDVRLLGKMMDDQYPAHTDTINFYLNNSMELVNNKKISNALRTFVGNFTDVGLLDLPLRVMPLFINAESVPIVIGRTIYYVHKTHQILARWRLKVGI